MYIWVDKDFAVARGLHQGYPKKLGSIHQTRPHPYGPAPRIEAGARFGATLAAADRRLAQAVVTLREPSESNGFVNSHPMAHHRWLPSVEKGKGLALDELIETGAASFEAGQAWVGDADLELFEAPTEELARLEIRSRSRPTTGRSASCGTAARCSSPEPPELSNSSPLHVTWRLDMSEHTLTVAGVAVDTRHWIGGERVASAGTFVDVSPIDGSVLGEIARGTAAEASAAVAAARAAFPGWAATPRAERARILHAVADAVEKRIEDLSIVETHDNGALLRSHRRGGCHAWHTTSASSPTGSWASATTTSTPAATPTMSAGTRRAPAC